MSYASFSYNVQHSHDFENLYLTFSFIYFIHIFENSRIPSYLPTYNTPTHYVFAYLGLIQGCGTEKKKKKKTPRNFFGPLFTNHIFMKQI
jgi:hypothetical protein